LRRYSGLIPSALRCLVNDFEHFSRVKRKLRAEETAVAAVAALCDFARFSPMDGHDLFLFESIQYQEQLSAVLLRRFNAPSI